MKLEFWKPEFSGHRTEVLLALTALTAVVACAWVSSAAAKEVYTWTDKNGIVHYGDMPPAEENSEKITVEDAYVPGTSGAYPTAAETADDATARADADPSETTLSAAQQRREKIAKERQERKELQAERREMCGKRKRRLEQLEPARRVLYINEQGEEVRMDDDQRMALIQEDKDYIAKNCE